MASQCRNCGDTPGLSAGVHGQGRRAQGLLWSTVEAESTPPSQDPEDMQVGSLLAAEARIGQRRLPNVKQQVCSRELTGTLPHPLPWMFLRENR